MVQPMFFERRKDPEARVKFDSAMNDVWDMLRNKPLSEQPLLIQRCIAALTRTSLSTLRRLRFEVFGE